jgi:type VI secretion system protein ImpB
MRRRRPPRKAAFAYDNELGDRKVAVTLPFVVGVISDLSGDAANVLPVVARRFRDFNQDNFDSRMKEIEPRAVFSVPDTLNNGLALEIDLRFKKMDDFSPIGIALQLGSLRSLLEARARLADSSQRIAATCSSPRKANGSSPRPNLRTSTSLSAPSQACIPRPQDAPAYNSSVNSKLQRRRITVF